jgi:hypothetical protein
VIVGEQERWFWCLRHNQPERGVWCPADERLGPYESADEAARWQERVEARNEAWEEQDRRWNDEHERD